MSGGSCFERLVGHISCDSTAIEARERPAKATQPAPPPRRKRGRPRKGEAAQRLVGDEPVDQMIRMRLAEYRLGHERTRQRLPVRWWPHRQARPPTQTRRCALHQAHDDPLVLVGQRPDLLP
jgi:hypothetical protein